METRGRKRMLKTDISIKGWIDFSVLNKYLAERNITEFCTGPRDNQTDGEWQRIYCQKDSGELFICSANIYTAYSFEDLIDWADQYS